MLGCQRDLLDGIIRWKHAGQQQRGEMRRGGPFVSKAERERLIAAIE